MKTNDLVQSCRDVAWDHGNVYSIIKQPPLKMKICLTHTEMLKDKVIYESLIQLCLVVFADFSPAWCCALLPRKNTTDFSEFSIFGNILI